MGSLLWGEQPGTAPGLGKGSHISGDSVGHVCHPWSQQEETSRPHRAAAVLG